MALKQRNTTRWTARVGTWMVTKAVAFALFVFEIFKSFLNIKEGDDFLTGGKKGADLVARRASYLAMDYYLFGVSISIGTTMNYLGYSFLWMFIALWIFDFVAAGAFILFYLKTGEDLSLGSDLRRVADTIHNAIQSKSRLAGLIAAVLTIIAQAILVIFWTGPEKVITFFWKEIGTNFRILVVLTVLTAIQSSIWAALYRLGYALITDPSIWDVLSSLGHALKVGF